MKGLQINSGAINISPERSPKILRYFYYEQVNRSNNALAVLVVLITGTATAIVEIIDAAAVGARHGISDPVTVAVVNTIHVVIILRAVGASYRMPGVRSSPAALLQRRLSSIGRRYLAGAVTPSGAFHFQYAMAGLLC